MKSINLGTICNHTILTQNSHRLNAAGERIQEEELSK
jgi:hypothetical protein